MIALAREPRVRAGLVAGVVVGSVVMALSARVAVHTPFTPVPITGQTLGLPLVVALLGTPAAVASLILYLFEGAIGLPVFAHGTGGLHSFIGPTGGYLLAFPLAAWVTGSLFDRGFWSAPGPRAVAILCGSAVVFLGGWAWLATLVGPGAAFATGVAPFLIGDLIKTGIATLVAPAFRSAGGVFK